MSRFFGRRSNLLSAICLGLCFLATTLKVAGQTESPKAAVKNDDRHIVILAGPITGHPKNTHEYEKSAILLKHLLDQSKLQVKTTVVFDGWPADPAILDSANTIVMISDGGDHKESNHPLYNADRLAQLEKQMDRGCGFVQLHWSTFNPSRYHDQITEWVGGYFDYEKGTAANKWYSAIKHYTEPIRLGELDHPISRGVKPFRVLEEFYYRIRFRDNDARLKKIVLSRPTGETKEFAVGWAVQRRNGGRGFGFTGGHYYQNWWEPNFRKLVINAIVWTAGLEVPAEGVVTQLEEPTRALILTGHNHPAHDWRKTTAALVQVIENDPRVLVDVTEDPEFLGSEKLSQYDVLVMNYSSWDRKGLSENAKKGFLKFLNKGGGLSVIHFANGSWTDTLPNNQADWPEYRTRIVRRIWDHGSGKSGHDAFGNFRVARTSTQHPITKGLNDFSTQDELYYRQQGPLPIEPLVTAKSRDTGKDEPMAWAYRYEKAKVFQTVLGHADVSILMAADLIRRGTIWSAGLDNLSFDPPIERKLPYLWRSGAQWSPKTSAAKSTPAPKTSKPDQSAAPKLVEGKFGKALNARAGGVLGESLPEIRDPELTLECWAKIDSKSGFNIIAASETKSSLKHWELYTYSGTGYLSVYMPGIFGEIRSSTDVCDGKWHYIAMTFEKQFVRLYVDGKQVKEQPINYRKHPDTNEGFAIGSLVEKTLFCDGLIDELRLSKEIKKIDSVPQKPLEVEEKTIGLWRFDKLNAKSKVDDLSKKKNDVALKWQGIAGKQMATKPAAKPEKITGHWGEDAIGFRWTEKDSEDNRWAFTKHGTFLASTIPLPGGFAEKGLVIKVGDSAQHSVCYDLKRMNLMAGWTDGFLEFHQARFGLIRHLKPAGRMKFYNQPGIAGNADQVEYQGLYLHGERVLLEYLVGDATVCESPWVESHEQSWANSREMWVGKSPKPIRLPLVSMTGAVKGESGKVGNREFVTIKFEDELIAATALSEHGNASIRLEKNQLWLQINADNDEGLAKVLIWRGKPNEIDDFKSLVSQCKLSDPRRFKKVGPKRWTANISTTGVIGDQQAWGYAVDTIRLPFRNPYNSLFFVSGHDWLDNGDMVVATVHGEVWLASNVNEDLKAVKWNRYATGLYQPLGIRVVDDKVYVLCRDQIVRLHDRDRNGEADYYECFHGDVTTSTGVHDYVCCLETDREGNFYYIHANDGVVRVSADGKDRKIVATGFRNPNGLGVRSDGLITAAPQEGEWTPASAVCEVIEGRHYGYRGPKQTTAESPLGYEKPMVFLPRLIDNSSGGQFWSESDKWGPMKNRLFHLSYGKCTMHLVLRDEVGRDTPGPAVSTQGAIVPFPFVFESGASRGRMNPHDGQLYVSGLKGWTTAAVRDGSIQRVRYLGDDAKNKLFVPAGYKVYRNGIEIEFTQPVSPESLKQTGFKIEAWNYRYSKNYGSPEFKLTNPNQKGRDQWGVKSARLMDNNRKLFLEVPQLQIADQVAIHLDVASSEARFDGPIYATIKHVRPDTIKPGLPFDQSLVLFEKTLQQGVHVASHGWRKSSLSYFAQRTGNKPDVPTRSSRPNEVKLVSWVQLESENTTLRFQTGNSTEGYYRIKPFSSGTADQPVWEGRLNSAGDTPILLNTDAEFCLVEVELKSADNKIAFHTDWESPEFGREPLPASATFLESAWLKKKKGPEDHASFLNATELIAERRCIQCHKLGQNREIQAADSQAPDLLDLENRLTPHYVRKKILEPHFENNGAEMPRLLSSSDRDDLKKTEDLMAFLFSRRLEKTESKVSAVLVEQGERRFEQLGCIGCHHLAEENGSDKFGRIDLRYTADKFTRKGLREFLKDPHQHAPFRKMGNFHLDEKEVESLAQLIEKYSQSKIGDVKTSANQPDLKAGDAENGKRLFVDLGCANCHQAGRESVPPKSFAWKRLDRGCLAHEGNQEDQSKSPRHTNLNPQETEVIRHYLAKRQNGRLEDHRLVSEQAIPTWRRAQKAIKSLRCNTCHDQSSQSATLPEIVFEEGVTGINPERLPSLVQVGDKLKSRWLLTFLTGKKESKYRPWLKTRMPNFGGYSELLAHGLVEREGRESQSRGDAGFQFDKDLVTIGRLLSEQNKGLDCRQCHGVGQLPPRGDEKTQIVLGINFSLVGDRLRKDYFDRWMRDPLRIDPQTKMPKYSTDGKTTKISEILNGSAEQQFEALWHYLKSVESKE